MGGTSLHSEARPPCIETSSKKLGDCKFHLLSPSLENEELSFLSFSMTGKAYQRLLKSKVADTARSCLKHLYDDEEDYSSSNARLDRAN